MSNYQSPLFIIILNLLCSVPVAILFIWIFGRDITSMLMRRFNPAIPYLNWKGDKPLPEELRESDAELVALGFVKLGAYERDLVLNQVMYWCYVHPNNPIVFVTIANDKPKVFTQFITVFDDDEAIMTFNGFTLDVDVDNAIINTVSGSLSEAYDYQQRIVESERARFGVPFTVQSVDDLLNMLQRVKNNHINEMFSSYYFGRRGLLFGYWILAALTGIVGLVLALLKLINTQQAETFGWVLAALNLLGITLFALFLVSMTRIASRSQRKNTKLKDKI